MSITDPETIPILIIGAGPCGLLLAYMLAKLGGMPSLPSPQPSQIY